MLFRSNQQTFLQATIRSGGDSSRMLSNLASLKLSQGDLEGARRSYEAALIAKPDQPFAMLGLSGALIRARAFSEARTWLAKCERIPLVRADAMLNLAVLEFQESGRERLDLLKDAAAINPFFWPLRKRYITQLIERGDLKAALLELQSVLSNQPFRAETWEMLGRVLEKSGQHPLAAQAFEEADHYDIHRKADVLR